MAPADLSIAVFADSADGRRAPGKAVAAATLGREQVPDHWGEREEEGREEGRVAVTRAPTVARGRGKREFRRLPTDFWHLLSNYIPPEKVATGLAALMHKLFTIFLFF